MKGEDWVEGSQTDPHPEKSTLKKLSFIRVKRPKGNPVTVKPKESTTNEDPQELQDSQ